MSHEVALVLGASIPAVLSFALGVLVLVRQKATHTTLKEIDRAVNNQPVGTPTIVQRVASIERHVRVHHQWQTECVSAISVQLGVRLPVPPALDAES